MPAPSPNSRLADIVQAIELIRTELASMTLAALELDIRKRWLIERGLEIISEASRHLPDEMKARHPATPWRKVAGIGNVLRHNYERVAHDLLWHVAHADLPPLYEVCRGELEAARGNREP